MDLGQRLWRQTARLLWIPAVRALVGYARFVWYARLRRRLRVMESTDAHAATVTHNLGALRQVQVDLTMDRADRLIRVVSAIETSGPESQVLAIGPRTEGDLLLLIANGFRRRNIEAIDLITYSPWIQLGDMHDIPHPGNRFDIVLSAWVLSYSQNPRRVAAEMLRVARDGALIAIGIDHNALSPEELVARHGYVIDGTGKRLNSAREVLDLFGDAVGAVHFLHDAPMKGRLDVLQARRGAYGNAVIMVVFSVRKPVAGNAG